MKNKSSLTIPQAVKVYTGNSFIANTLEASAVFIGILLLIIIIGLFVVAISKGFDIDAMKEAFSNNRKSEDTYVFEVVIGIFVSILPICTLLKDLKKDYPGGKYFRTVQGGFDTFRKYFIGSYIAIFIEIAILFLFIVLSQIYRLTTHGLSFVITMFIFCLIGISVSSVFMSFHNKFIQNIVFEFSSLLTIIAVLITSDLNSGLRAVILAAAAVLTIVLTPINLKLYLEDYRQQFWTE